METSKVIESYKDSFKSPLGAYIYMLLNQSTPEFFTVSSDGLTSFTQQLESLLVNATDINSLITNLTSLPDEQFTVLQQQNQENDLSKSAMLKRIENMKYLQVDWNSENSWNELSGFIEYNEFSLFINNKEILQQKLKESVKNFSLASFSLNPNFNPYQFLEEFEDGVKSMCEVLNINPKQIGLNVLNINYKTEEGDFTGYVTWGDRETPNNSSILNKMVINKPEVFAHEWMHFVESALGVYDYSFTAMMDYEKVELFKKVLPEYDKLFQFKDTINQKEKHYSKQSLSDSLKSAAHFYERYAIDSQSFYLNIEKISNQFEKDYEDGKNKDECLKALETSISELLQNPHPPRYFSFLKAQCDLYIDKINNQALEKNQFMDFAKKSDDHLQLDDYTQSTIESFARSFEAFLYDKIKSTDKKCCLISSSYDSDFYPQAEMKTKLNSLWDGMWSQIKDGIDKVNPIAKDNKLEQNFILTNVEQFRSKYLVTSSHTLNNKIN